MPSCDLFGKRFDKKPIVVGTTPVTTPRSSCSSWQDVDDIEEGVIKEKMFCNQKLDALIILRILAIIVVVLECTGIYFSDAKITTYALSLMSISSLLFCCALITAIQEESRKFIHAIVIWLGFKIGLMLLSLTILFTIVYTDTFKPHLKNWLSQDSVIVTIISTVVICLTIIQMFLSTKAFRYFELRDEIYTIPTFKVDRIRPEFGHVIHHGHIYI